MMHVIKVTYELSDLVLDYDEGGFHAFFFFRHMA